MSDVNWWDEVEFAPEEPEVLRLGDRDEAEGGFVTQLQEALQRVGEKLSVDGIYGTGTERAVHRFQKRVGLVADGIAGEKTTAALEGYAFPESLQQKDLDEAAQQLECDVLAIMAVSEVESRGRGFFSNARPVILFERHWMRRRLKHYGLDYRTAAANSPDIVNGRAGGYKGGVAEYDRLERARAIDDTSALESASWGAYQIMGFHWRTLGYPSVQHMVGEMEKGEPQHLEAFVRFIKADDRLHRAIQQKAWLDFALIYNGRGQKGYDHKMENAYNRLKNV